ncbi:MAG: S1C family serine protease [Acidimicrobiales bacterium]
MAALLVVIVALLVAGGVGVVVTTRSTSTNAGPPTEGSSAGITTTTNGPPRSNGSAPPSSSPSTTAPAPKGSGLAPVSPLTVPPPASVPPVVNRPLGVPASVIAARVDPAVVDVDTRLSFQQEIAEGTGMILTSNGVVLTNNHVIDGATTIEAVSVGNGRTYPAAVLGVDPTADVAVIKLQGASGLPTVSLSAQAAVPGDAVVALGNAGGVGGTPSVATGNVAAIDQSIIADDAGDGSAEQLDGLIETTASLQPGDSGGPLVNAGGQIIGMDTAASSPSGNDTVVSFAIPIADAMGIAQQIEQGQSSNTVFLGVPGFLGVTVVTAAGPGGQTGALINGVVAGSPAEGAGMADGDLITVVSGTAIDSSAALTAVLRRTMPGQRVTIGWIDRTGVTHMTPLVLGTGPAA